MRERVRVRSRVVLRLSRREQDGIEASSIDRDDERLKIEEIRDSNEWSRCACMGLI